MRDSELEEIGARSKICIKDCNKLIVLNIIAAHCRLEVPGFVAGSDGTVSMDYVDPLPVPSRNFVSDEGSDAFVVGIIKNLNQQTLFRPIELTNCRNRHLIHLKFSTTTISA